MVKKRMLTVGKYFFYTVLMVLLYVLQTTPGFLEAWGVRPILVIPFAICIAIYEGEFIGGLLGMLAGLLCDMGAYTFFGFYSITLFLYCVGAGLMIIYFMKNNFKNAFILTLTYIVAMGFIEFLFYYVLWGYSGWPSVLVYTIIPRTLYSTAFSLPMWLLVGKITDWFVEKAEA